MNSLISLIFGLVLLMWVHHVHCQCPQGIRQPCTCATTRYEPIHIVCENAPSLTDVLSAIGRPNVLIDSLIISNTPIDNLPGFVFGGLSIKRLVLRHNRLASIDPNAFEGPLRTTLRELEIRNNFLTNVPQIGVTTLRSLTTLVLSKNRIQSIQPGAFDAYVSKTILRKLDFSSNQLADVHEHAFAGGLSSIQEINFDKNFLSRVPTAALRSLSSLEDLSLAVNQLIDVPIGSLPLPNLKSLSLEVNRIGRIEPEALAGVPNLLYLYLSANNFTALEPELFKYVPQLKVLAMGNNALTVLPSNSFRNIPGLVRLEMSECKIERIEPNVFQTIPKVQVIVLNKNLLTQIETNTFRDLSELYSLDLKGNQISFVADKAWSQLKALRHLDVSTNKLQTLAPGTFFGTFERTSPPTTRVLYIYENVWTCDERLEWFRRWLRDNMDVMIDAPGYPPSVCWKPDWLRSWPVRSANPATSAPPTDQTTIDDGKVTDSLQDQRDDAETHMSAVNLTAMTLGIILGIFLLTLLLLMIVRYFVSKNRREMKERVEEDRRRFGGAHGGSTLSGYNPSLMGGMGMGMGAAYPSPPLGDESPSSAAFRSRPPRNGYFLNRPWYWWF